MACSKKFIFVILFTFFILFAFASTVRAEWTDTDIENVQNALATITGNQGVVISQLQSIGVNVTDCETMLNRVNDTLKTLKTDTSNINKKLTDITNTINLINTNITNIYNTLNANQQQLLQQMKKDNENIMNELSQIKDILAGASEDSGDLFAKNHSIYHLNKEPGSSSSTYTVSSSGYSIQSFSYRNATTNQDYTFQKGSNYTVKISKILTSNSSTARIYYTFDDVSVGKDIYLNYAGTFSQSNYSFTFTAKSDKVTFFITDTTAFWGNMVRYTISKSTSVNDTLNNLDNSINNTTNTIKDDNVNADVSSLPQDNTQDITEDGFNNIFTQLYNTFTSSEAKDLVITIPFTQKSFIINASNVYGSANLGFVKTLIEAFWYFTISYFIVKDIGHKINKIKSGDIEHVQDDNIKEGML